MTKKIRRHKYGGIHGITIFIKEFIAQRCIIIQDLSSESILWIRINDKLSGIDLLLGAVYLPHEASDYYHEDIFEHLTDDIITIKAKYQVPIVLLGDFNSRVGLKNDVECEPDDEECCIDEKQMFLYFEEHNLMNRVNMDAYVNNNGNRLIELCRMSNLKIANGRIGRDKRLGNFTCYTSNGQSTIDYAIVSMELFPNIVDFYVDVLDKCLSDVHCPICLEMSFKTSASNRNDNVNLYNSKYVKEKNTTCRWKNDLGNQYTLSYETESIVKFQEQLHCIMYRLSYVSQEMIDVLYEDMKSLFINPARKVGIYKEFKNNSKSVTKKSRRHGKKTWFNNECEMLRNQYMSIKNSLKPENASDQQYQIFHEHGKMYKKVINKTKKKYTIKFQSEIRNLKTTNPKEFWKIIKTESSYKLRESSLTIFTEFVDHFREINIDPVFTVIDSPLCQVSVNSQNEAINKPFSVEEITLAIKKLKNNKASGVDNIINEFFKYCPHDCIQIIVDFLNIVLNTGFIPTEWCLGIISPLYKNRGAVNDPDNYRGITLLSCTGKLFTACLNYRLSGYVEDNILGKEQAGFRVGYSTIDHIFVLQIIIELYQSVKKRVYCAFIDYRKAFDFVNRPLLWQKLLSYEINGKLFNVVKNMYDKAKSCIKKDTLWSHYFCVMWV